MQDDEAHGSIPVPDYLKLPVVESRKYALDEAAKLIAGRYGNVDDVLDFITEQAGEHSRDIDAEAVLALAAAYRCPTRKGTVTGCEALHWIAFGFLVSDDEARAREEHLGHRWCHAPLAAARPALEAAAEDPPRYAAPHHEEVIQLMLGRVAPDGEAPIGPRKLLALYDRDTAEEEWRRKQLRSASRRLLVELQQERFVAWGEPSDGSGRREIPLKFLTTPGMVFSTTSRFEPDREADMDVWAARRKELVWREIVLPARAIYELRDPNGGRAIEDEPPPAEEEQMQQFVEWMNAEKEKHGTYPPRDPDKKGRDCWAQWGQQRKVPRATLWEWVKTNNLRRPKGAPKKSAEK